MFFFCLKPGDLTCCCHRVVLVVVGSAQSVQLIFPREGRRGGDEQTGRRAFATAHTHTKKTSLTKEAKIEDNGTKF